MITILLIALFASAGVFALASIWHSIHRYGPAALALQGELRNCSEWREVWMTAREVKIHPAGAIILRHDFKAKNRSSSPERVLPAAA